MAEPKKASKLFYPRIKNKKKNNNLSLLINFSKRISKKWGTIEDLATLYLYNVANAYSCKHLDQQPLFYM